MIFPACRLQWFLAFSALLVVPITAQFGVAGGKRQAGANFEELQEMAKKSQQQQQMGGGDDMDAGDYAQQLQQMMKDPDYLNKMGEFGDQFGQAMEQMMKMSPEELAQQMEQAMKMMTDGDVVENVLNQKDEVLKNLEATGAVPPEELAKYKADPNYFELKMRESFQQMGELMNNPEYVNTATEMMKGMKDMMDNPEAMQEMMQAMVGEFEDDEKIEETRKQLLSGEVGDIPGMKEAFETEEMQEILKDPKKWKETVKEGFAGMFGGNLGTVKEEL